VAIGILLLAGRSLPANNHAADEPAPPAADAATQTKDAKQDNDGEKLPGRVIIPKYRLGAALAPVPKKLNDQLKLDGAGLLIDRVAPGGPAEKAGVKRNDILLAIGDRPIMRYVDLVEASNASGPKTSMKLLRDGKPITVTVTLDKHRKNDEKVRVPSNPR
jgi:S1-C subfamily serine protease